MPFDECKVEDIEGGTIYWKSGSGKLNNTDFTNCSALSSTTSANGAVIYWDATTGTVDYCNFKDCSVIGSSGGTVY